MMWWMTSDTTHDLTRTLLTKQLAESIMAVLVLSWVGRHVGFLARKDAMLARNSNL